MIDAIFSPAISTTDRETSLENIELLRNHLAGGDRSLVFFVGAGASMAGNTGIPSTPSLLDQLLSQSLITGGKFDPGTDVVFAAIQEISTTIGFEITLNDFWQICRQATALIYHSFGELETRCEPNNVHAFLARWLISGGSVVTTNYDRLIERAWSKAGGKIQSRYSDTGASPFAGWREGLLHGGTLFKIHGSLDDPESCLGALEHVGTQLSGERAHLLEDVVLNRPLCFVGWRGIDPDIPPLLNSIFAKRDPSLPTFWLHYEGNPSKPATLHESIQGCSDLIRPLAGKNPILTEADRAFGDILGWIGAPTAANSMHQPESFDFSNALNACTKTGLCRMVGITLRRAGKLPEAARVLDKALDVAQTAGERSAALQEKSLLHQQHSGSNASHAFKSLEQARKALESEPDIRLQLNADFGMLSMSVVSLKKQPWLLPKIPGLFRRYRRDIDTLGKMAIDRESVALHTSLYHLYLGRLRFKLFAWLGAIIPPLRGWILEPFDAAYTHIDDAKDIHLHSRVDVLAYRLVALAQFGHCRGVQEEIQEIDRLVGILKDDARLKHWENQKVLIRRYC